MRRAWFWGSVAVCLVAAQSVIAQVRPMAGGVGGGRVQQASYCAGCGAETVYHGGTYASGCGDCGLDACTSCGPCGGCGSLLAELVCDVRAVVEGSVVRVARCLFPAGLCCSSCDPCADPYVAAGGVGWAPDMPMLIEGGPMLQPTPAPPTRPGDPFGDEPAAASASRLPGGAYPSASTAMAPTRGRTAGYDATQPLSQMQRYRPRHVSQLRRAAATPQRQAYDSYSRTIR